MNCLRAAACVIGLLMVVAAGWRIAEWTGFLLAGGLGLIMLSGATDEQGK